MLPRVSSRSFSTSVPRAVKVSSAPAPGSEVSSLKVVVKNAGSKASAPGLAHLLASSSFLNTEAKTGLRLKREAELLGGEYKASVTRDSIVLETKFLKESLPYFVNALGDVLTSTSFKPHELKEIALPYAQAVSATAAQSSEFKALEELHAVSFRKGYGKPLYYDGSKSYSSEDVAAYAKSVFLDGNVEVVGSNVVESDLSQFIKESSFSKLPAGSSSPVEQKTHFGADSRIRQAGPTTAVIGLPVEDASTFSLVSAYLKASLPQSSLAVSINSKVITYDAASLFYVSITSSSASEVASLLSQTAKLLKSASDLTKYKSLASYILAEAGESVDIASAKSSVSVPKFNLVVVGDVDAVPYSEEL